MSKKNFTKIVHFGWRGGKNRIVSAQAWHAYYKSELREVARRCEHRSGFPGFKHVFFVSALEDVGVDDLNVSNAQLRV